MKYYVDLLNATKDVVKLYKEKHPYMKYFLPNTCTDFRVNKYERVDLCLNTQILFIIVMVKVIYGFPSWFNLVFLNDGYEGGEFI